MTVPLGSVVRHEEDLVPRRTPEQIERRVQEASGGSEFYRRILSRNLAPPATSITTAEEISERIEAAQAAGATHCNVGFPYRDLSHALDGMEWFAREVMPRYR